MPVTVEPVGDVAAVLGEGPYWRPEDDALLWVDVVRGHLHLTRVQSGETITIELDTVSAAFPAVGGGLVTAGGHRLMLRATRPGEGWAGRIIAEAPAGDGVRFNDASVDPAGRVWVGSMDIKEKEPLGTLYRLDSGGALTPVVKGATVSNGIGWSPDGTRMYYNDSPLRRIDMFDYDQATGEAYQGRMFADLSGAEGFPDGLTVDADGCVWVAMFAGGALRRFTPAGHQDAVIPLPVSQPTSCAFGGPGLADLFVTTAYRDLSEGQRAAEPLAGRLLRLRPGPVGLPSSAAQAVVPS